MKKTIYFDMDNTLNRFYQVPNWIPRLQSDDASVYYDAQPWYKYISLLKNYKSNGYKVIILTCLSYDTNKERDEDTIYYKKEWLKDYVGMEYIDDVRIIPYTHHKEDYADEHGILVDDDDRVLVNWPWETIKVTNI